MVQQFTTFQGLKLYGWRQFAFVDIEFHRSMTVLTGANGAGKSSLLNILSRQLGSGRPFLSVPKHNSDGTLQYHTGVFELAGRLSTWFGGLWKRPTVQSVGEVSYADGKTGDLRISLQNPNEYELQASYTAPVMGFHISSHRNLSRYLPLGQMPFEGYDPDQAFDIYFQENHRRHLTGEGGGLLPNIKAIIAAWAVVGQGNTHLKSNTRQKEAFEGFVKVLSNILPESLGFKEISIRPPGIVLVTRTGEFPIDAASGGISALFEFAALIYTCSLRRQLQGEPFVVTIDEPENHLHPTLQRTLLPSLVRSFPKTQFIVATHSPFMVSSVKESNVYALKYDSVQAEKSESGEDIRRVTSEKLDYVNRAGPASEILHDVLGVPSTLPAWVEDEISTILRKYRDVEISERLLKDIQADMKQAGMSDFYSTAIANLAKRQ